MRARIVAGIVALGLSGPVAAKALADRVYVPLGNADEILIVDSARDTVTGRILGVPNVHGLAGTPDGKLLIAGSYNERPASAPAPEKPGGISAEDHEAHHAPAPAGQSKPGAMVSTLTVVRTSDRQVVRRIDVPGAVHHVAASPKGAIVAVTHPRANLVSLVDVSRMKVIGSVVTGTAPNYSVFSPDGAAIYVTNAGNRTVSVVDVKGRYVKRNFRVGAAPEHLALSRDGKSLYINNVRDGTVSAISVKDGAIRTFDIGGVLHGIDLSDDEGTLFVAARGRNRLVAVDISSGKKREVKLAPAPYHLTVIRGTGKMYVSSAGRP